MYNLKSLLRSFDIGQRFEVYSREQDYCGCIMSHRTLNGAMVDRLGKLPVKKVSTIKPKPNVIIINLG